MNNFKLIAKSVMFLSGLFFIGSCQAGTCDVPPIHMTGVVNITVSKYGRNYNLTRGDFHVTSASTTEAVNCHFNTGDSTTTGSSNYRLTNGLPATSDAKGNFALRLPDAGSNIHLGIEPSITIAGADPKSIYPTTASTFSSYSGEIVPAVDVITLDNGLAVPTDSGTSVVYSVPVPIMQVSLMAKQNYYGGGDPTPFYDFLYLDSLTVNYLVTSCGIKSKQGTDVTWPSLTKSEIVNGTAPVKPYALSLICGEQSDIPSPVNITFSATNGFADAANGIVKTNLDSVGLKLSWANPALPPLMLDQVNRSTLSGVGDYTVLAKPVKITSESGAIMSGYMDTSVTMTVEFP